MRISNIRLNKSNAQDNEEAKERIKDADKRSKASKETIEDAWIRVGEMKFSEKERELFLLAEKSFKDGKVGRLSDGRLTKSEVLRMGKIVQEVIEKELREERIKETLENKPKNYHVLIDDKDLPKFVERIREEVRIQRDKWCDRFEMLGVDSMTAGDFEGTGIDSYIDLTIGFSIWLPLLDEGYYLAYGHVPNFDVPYAFEEGDKQLTRSKVISAISPYLKSPQQGKTFHMGAARYDMHVAENDGYSMRGVIWDTLDAMRTMNEHEESFALKRLIQKYGKMFGIESDVYTFEDLFGNASPAPYNTEIVGIYAINDVKYGWKLFEWQFELMKKTDNLMESYVKTGKDLPETDVFLERCGFRLDFDLLRELEVEFEEGVKEAERAVFETYGIDDEFVRKMDRAVNAKKIEKWIESQEKRIEKKKSQIDKKAKILSDLEAREKTHLKKYTNEKELYEKYRREYTLLKEPTIDNAPQEITEFSITNGNHLAYLIYDILEIRDRTYLVDASKKRSTAAAVMEYYYEEEPTLKPLADVAEYSKLLTTYIRPYLSEDLEESAIEVTGRVHSNFKAGGTATGRYSSSSYNGRPTDLSVREVTDENYLEVVGRLIADERKTRKGVNLQQIPARTTNGKRVRNAFIPRDGWIFVGSDLGQIEPRIQAHIMYTKYGDNSMRSIFVEGVDLYTTMAMRVFGFDEEYCLDKAKDPSGKFEPRAVMKTGILAKSYGQSAQAFSRNMGIPIEAAEHFFEGFDEQFPSFTQMVADIQNDLKTKGYVETLYGRKRRFPEYRRLKREVDNNEQELIQLYVKRKQLRNKKRTDKVKRQLKALEDEIKPLADRRNLVSYWERASFNAVIQGTGADILKMIGVEVAKLCKRKGWEFNASIHDEVKISLPRKELTKEVIEKVKEIMTETSDLSVPLVTDTVIEPRWAEEYSPEEWDFGN